MGRVINLDGVGKKRNQLIKAVVIALRELAQQRTPDDSTRDLAAFIALSLNAVAETIERSVTPWEKRGYWVKADRFRLEWEWSGKVGDVLHQAVLVDDWATIAQNAGIAAEKLSRVNVSTRHRMGKPWVGAWQKLKASATDK